MGVEEIGSEGLGQAHLAIVPVRPMHALSGATAHRTCREVKGVDAVALVLVAWNSGRGHDIHVVRGLSSSGLNQSPPLDSLLVIRWDDNESGVGPPSTRDFLASAIPANLKQRLTV